MLRTEDELVADLTPPQREAVLCTEGPLLVLAGPGSGKTRVITHRIAHLLGLGVPPWKVLAVTFTNKAAGEMRHRVAAVLSGGAHGPDGQPLPPPRGLTVTTFHSLCVRLLRRYADLWNAERAASVTAGGQPRPPVIKADFTVYDADDQQALLKRVMGEMQLSTSTWPPRSVLGIISTSKNDLKDAAAFTAEASDFHGRTIAKVFAAYDAALRAAGAADFDDLLLLTARMLKESTAVRTEIRRRYRYLLVDEYQDTNTAQFVIASLIAGEDPGKGAAANEPRPNICVVGDPDQSIYGWRGADIANILGFEEHYPSARVIALGENFRSLAPILGAADRLIQHNARRKHKPLIAMRGPISPGAANPIVEVAQCRDEHHEAALVLDWLRTRQRDGHIDWKDAAVFYRTNALSRVMEDSLRQASIPYTIVRGTAFYQREEVKHALGYLRVLANPADGVSLRRIVNVPARGIGDSSWEKIEGAATEQGLLALAVARDARMLAALVATRAASAVAKFVAMLDDWLAPEHGVPRNAATENDEDAGMFAGLTPEALGATALPEPAPEGALALLVERVVRESGLEQMYREDEDRLENLAELVSSAREFEEAYRAEAEPDAAANADGEGAGDAVADEDASEFALGSTGSILTTHVLLRAYLERVALVADTDALNPAQGAVTLMTLHAAKGLEYKAVALIGLEESILPHSRGNESDAELEEERRLCFVGVTRAMDQLLITTSRYRTIRGLSERMIPSRFLDELRGEGVAFVDHAGDPLAWGAGGGTGDEFDDEAPSTGSWGRRAGGRAGGSASSRDKGDPGFRVGSKVRHPQFGPGVVEAVTGGGDARVRVRFNGVGTKTLVLAYARLESMER